MSWRPGNNTIEDADPSEQFWQFLNSLETPDESKAIVKRRRGPKRVIPGPRSDIAVVDDDGLSIASRTHRESSPTGRHSPPHQTRYIPGFHSEEDRPQRRESSSSSSLSSFISQSSLGRKQRFNDHASVSIDPSKAEDVTLHLSLPTDYDLEGALEETARLRRIGHFKAAIELYEQDLGQFLDIKYVMIQYGECLLEAGQMSKFSGLCMKLPNSHLMDSLDLNWACMKLRPDIQTSPLHLQDVLDDALEIVYRNWPRLDSTEVRLLICGFDRITKDLDWHRLYRHFRDEYMIWEFHDLFVSMASKLSPELCWRRFFPWTRDIPISYPALLHQDWVNEGTNTTSAIFALLEILTTSGLYYLRVLDTKAEALECLEKAGEYAALLRSQDASNIKSRPYLRWMVAKAMIEECPCRAWTLKMHKLGSLKPLIRGFWAPTGVFPDQHWPLYAPFGNEQIRLAKANNVVINKKLVTIAKAAEEIGDFLLRTACLKELVLNRAEGIEDIMETLEDLWKESGHADSVSQMHLYQYLLIKEPSDDDKVRRRILLDGEMSTGWVNYARCRVMAALATSERERDHYQQKAEDYNHSHAALSRTRERSVSRERSHTHIRGHDSRGPHRSSGGREQEKSPSFLTLSDSQKRNGKSQEPSLQTLQPHTLAPIGPLTPKRLALKEQEQNEIIRSREKEDIGKQEDDAIGTPTAASGKMTDLTVTENKSKNLVTAEHEDEDAKSDETEILRSLVIYSDPEGEDLSLREKIDMLRNEIAELANTHDKEDEKNKEAEEAEEFGKYEEEAKEGENKEEKEEDK